MSISHIDLLDEQHRLSDLNESMLAGSGYEHGPESAESRSEEILGNAGQGSYHHLSASKRGEMEDDLMIAVGS